MSGFRFSRIGRKIIRREGYHLAGPTHAHWCEACGELHDYAVEQPFRNGARWTFNGAGERPTFSPSMNISIGPFPDGRVERCHYFVTDGQIRYLGDCTHALAGQTLELRDIPDEALRYGEEIGEA